MRYQYFLAFIFVQFTFSGFSQVLENIRSTMEIYTLATGERTVLWAEEDHFEAPNWPRDGQSLLFNIRGLLHQWDLASKTKTLVPTGNLKNLNNDHGIAPDGSQLLLSNNEQRVKDTDYPNGSSRIYVMNRAGGVPKLLTEKAPSYWHGWTQDGKEFAYVALRNGDYDIYKMDINGGEEIRLTTSEGLDDGPDYSPDGTIIYYNSMASGRMELWQMNADGSEAVQLTNDPYSNWFPHPSPDGNYLVYISYYEDQGSNHPAMKKVALKLYDLRTKEIKTLCSFTGGQGTINVPSWSPDSTQFAFVSYVPLNQ